MQREPVFLNLRSGGSLQTAVIVMGLAATLALAACAGDNESKASSEGQTSTTSSAGRIPRACGTYDGRGCLPVSRRVDLDTPAFSNSTDITNPLFPISRLHSALLLGSVEGKQLRVETTLLPGTKTIVWAGRRIDALTSQYVAYLNGRIAEVALDWYAQADDGSVWYLGEDVFNYENGVVADTEGTWQAGREGSPVAMIMPADPEVGDVFRPENIVGGVFEEVEVRSIGKTVAGPRGAVKAAIVTSELHLDGTREAKTFAPGYGEFFTGSGGEVEAVALAVPTDALPGPPPAALESLSSSAAGIFDSVRAEDWDAATATLEHMNAAWKTLRADDPPPRVAAHLRRALETLAGAVRAERSQPAARAAIDVAQSALDLELRHRPPTEIDAARFDLRARQLLLDAADGDLAGVTGDVAVLEWLRDRIAHTLRPAGRLEVDTRLRALRAAADARNLPAAGDHAVRLAARVRGLTAPGGRG